VTRDIPSLQQNSRASLQVAFKTFLIFSPYILIAIRRFLESEIELRILPPTRPANAALKLADLFIKIFAVVLSKYPILYGAF